MPRAPRGSSSAASPPTGGRIAFPGSMAAAVWLLAALPARLADALLGRLPRKGDAHR
ncbi:MAG: hypothetical protein WDO24_16035 [Pseudomonadota bacterium]